MNKRRPIIFSLAAIIVMIAASIWFSLTNLTAESAFAAQSSADIILKKTLLNGLETCYNDTYMKKSIIPADFSGPSSLMETGFFGGGGTKDGVIRVPNNVGNTLSDADISCQQLFNGYSGTGGRISGLFSLFGKSSSATNETQKIQLLENLGYYVEQTTGSTETGCVSISYQTVVNSQYTDPISTNQICFKLTDGNVDVGYSSEGVTYNGEYTSPLYIYYNPVDYQLALMSTESTYPINYVSLSPYRTPSWDDFKSSLNNFVGDYNYTDEYGYNGYHYNVQKAETSSAGGETFSEAVRSSNAARDALHFFSGEPNATFTTYSFVSEDKYALYTAYLNQELQNNSNVIMGSGSECSSSKETAKSSTGYAVRNGAQWCALHGVESGNHYNVIENRLNNKLVDGTFADVVNGLMELDYDKLENSGVEIGELEDGEMSGGANTGTTPGGENGDDGTVATCFNSAGSLGWILCPVIGAVGDVTSGLYNIIKASFLEIKSDFMSTDNGTYEGWKIFRDIANVLFVIMFVIVILAQVTGIGISNYNIKKILPRLVMVVALVNISFILCQFAVDISNILGNGLEQMFSNIRFKGATAFDLGDFVVGLLGTLGVGAFAVGGAAIAISTWELWLIPLLLTLLACLISILFFFILLGVRQAGVIILVVLAPVAIVCYALPNAKSIFDKWRKMFVALLMVYPICGLLMGGGKFASMLLLTVGNQSGEDINFFYNLVAMLLQVVPFFFIPSILKSSMAAMGNLGMKISNMGTRWGNAARRTVGNSRIVQERQRELARNNNQRRDLRLASRYKASADTANSQVKGFENRLRGAGIDLSDDKAVRRFLGNEYGAYRRAKNKQASMNYRTNQARKRYESSVMEDAAAATGASRELLTPGTRRYESYMEGLESAQRIKDAADQQRLFEAGRGTYTDASGTVHDINAGDIASLGDAHARFLEQLRDNPNDVETRAKLEAVQDMLAARGDKGHEAMYRNYESLANSSTADQLKSDGLRYAANHLSKYTPQIKKGSRSFDKLLNQYQAGTVDSFRSTAAANGKTLEEELDTNSALGYNASSFNDMNENAIQRYIDMAEHGKLDSKQLQHLTKIANEALNNDQIQLKGDVEKQLHDFLSAAYGTGAVGHSTLAQGQSTIGSDAIKNASLSSLNDVAQRIQNNDITGAAATKLVENARRYMESGETIDADRAQALRKIISTAQTKGVDSLDKINGVNAGDNFSYDEASFKVRGAKATAKMPTGWTRNASGTWVNITSGAPLTPTEVRKAEEIERYNNQRDIESGKYS